MFLEFTYSDMKKQDSRDEIMSESFCSVGTKSGNFGLFQEHFRTISKNGAEQIKDELEYAASAIGVNYDDLMEVLPKIKDLIS